MYGIKWNELTMPKDIQLEAPQPPRPAASKNKIDNLTASDDAPSPKKRRLDNQEHIISPWCTKEQLSNLSLAQVYELIGSDIDVHVKRLLSHIPSGENRTSHFYGALTLFASIPLWALCNIISEHTIF